MKRSLFIVLLAMMLYVSCGPAIPSQLAPREVAAKAQDEAAKAAVVAVPIPQVSYFQEK